MRIFVAIERKIKLESYLSAMRLFLYLGITGMEKERPRLFFRFDKQRWDRYRKYQGD